MVTMMPWLSAVLGYLGTHLGSVARKTERDLLLR
jgi:hypothetical protein